MELVGQEADRQFKLNQQELSDDAPSDQYNSTSHKLLRLQQAREQLPSSKSLAPSRPTVSQDNLSKAANGSEDKPQSSGNRRVLYRQQNSEQRLTRKGSANKTSSRLSHLLQEVLSVRENEYSDEKSKRFSHATSSYQQA